MWRCIHITRVDCNLPSAKKLGLVESRRTATPSHGYTLARLRPRTPIPSHAYTSTLLWCFSKSVKFHNLCFLRWLPRYVRATDCWTFLSSLIVEKIRKSWEKTLLLARYQPPVVRPRNKDVFGAHAPSFGSYPFGMQSLNTLEAYIFRLPNELIQQCLGHCLNLDDADCWLETRLVCKTFRDSSLKSFRADFFRHINVLLHPSSLETLTNIAFYTELASCVQRITITCRKAEAVASEESTTKDGTLDNAVIFKAFGCFSLLESIEVDANSFFTSGWELLKCGKHNIGTVENWDHWDLGFDFALQALVDAGKHMSVKIGLHLPHGDADEPRINLSLYAAHWASCSSQVRSLVFSGDTSMQLDEHIFQSTSNLEHLGLNSTPDCFVNRQLTRSHDIWPSLSSFDFIHISCPHILLLDFLDRVRSLVVRVSLIQVTIPDGTWEVPLTLMSRMPMLASLYLSNLVADSPWSNADFDQRCSKLKVHGKTKATLRLQSTLLDFRTMQPHSIHSSSWVRFSSSQ